MRAIFKRRNFQLFVVFMFLFIGTAVLLNSSAGVTVKLTDDEPGLTLLDQDRQGMTIRMDLGSIEFIKVQTSEGSFILPHVKGFTRSFKEGEPTIPIASGLLDIPYECQLKVKVLDFTTQEIRLADYGLTDPLFPVQPPLSKSENPANVPFLYKRHAYEGTGKYSLPLASVEVLGNLRETRLGRLSIAPVEYYPSGKKLTVYTSVTVQITYKNANWNKTKEMKGRHKSAYFTTLSKQIVNYEMERAEADLIKYPVKYLIISDRMFETQLQPFIQWKTKKGFKVVVGYTDVIGTTTTAIKSYIQTQYNNGTTTDPAPSFVLFVGDVQQIPAFAGSAGSHITDLRYCELTGDNYPEIYYGRFSAQNTTQLQPQIDKTLEYEKYLMPDPSYLSEVTLVSGVDSSYAATYGNGQINYGTTYYFNAAHGIAPNVWLYPASDASGVSTQVIQTINAGVGLYNYTAHCGHTGPSDPPFSTTDISSLTNSHKYLLGIGNCCLSNTFGSDYSTPCFGEAWLQAADKGGIGWIGGSNSTYWDEDYWWGVGNGPIVAAGPTYEQTGIGAYDGVFHDHGEPVSDHYITNGAMIFAGNMAVTAAGSSRIQYYWEIYHLMGDPSVMTYMGVPSNNTVTHPSSVTPSATTINVQAVPGSYVGISRNNVLYGAGYIGTSGTATIALTPFATTGTADIVVTCQNRIPYVSTIAITSGTEPPTAAFVGSPTSGTSPLTVNFSDQSISATSWSWDFGDTGTSTLQNPSHTYNTAGTYTVTLNVTNSYGSDSEVKTNYITVTVPQAPVANFSASSTNIQAGQTVTFTDQSTNNPTSWSWSFTGGTPATSTAQNPTVTYSTPGTYTVSLTATNAVGSDSETKNNYITVTEVIPEYCASQGSNYSYEWIASAAVGPLNNSSGAAGYTDFTSITTELTAGGTYNVTLTPGFSSSTYTEYWKIWIDYNRDGDFTDSGEEAYSGTGTAAVSGSLTIPSGLSVNTRMRITMKYNAVPTPCETFSYGEVEDYTVNITPGTIVNPPVANFSANFTTIDVGDTVTFTDLSTNNPTAWSWSFPGGTPSTSTAENPTVTYNTAGTYNVTLTASNSAGSDAETKNGYITVNSTGTALVYETGVLTNVSSTWQTVTLQHNYTSMVVVATNNLPSGARPAVTRIRNASGNSFEIRVQNPSNLTLSGFTVHYLVVEEGVYTVADHGVKMEAKKVLSTATANSTSWTTLEQRTFSNTYTTPVVLGQVMSYNDTNWSVFWASASLARNPPTASQFYAGKHVGQDTNKNTRKSRENETLGIIVFEKGSGTLNGVAYRASVGSDIVRGPDNTTTGYTYSFTSVPSATTAILSAAAMDNTDGGWPVFYKTGFLTTTSLKLVTDEDQIADTERGHTADQVAYVVIAQ